MERVNRAGLEKAKLIGLQREFAEWRERTARLETTIKLLQDRVTELEQLLAADRNGKAN